VEITTPIIKHGFFNILKRVFETVSNAHKIQAKAIQFGS
jgi:hypothetical protein